MIIKSKMWLPGLFVAGLVNSQFIIAQNDEKPQLEEVLIYGQKNEATVSDISISITAMDEGFLEDMGIQGPDEIINFIPATTRTAWDIKIRGVGRNFRGLGGDPGVGTYYNGVYSPDFGIASTEGGLFDLARVEVLRGPQGTLYGRNSIGGVINYVTNKANHEEFEAKAKVVLGQYGTNEWYGLISGPLTENLAYRLVHSDRNGDGRIDGLGPSTDMADTNDYNTVLTLDWNIREDLSLNVRVNNRLSDRHGNFGSGGHGMLSEGPCIPKAGLSRISKLSDCDPKYRVNRDTNHFVTGLREVGADFEGAFPYTHPISGEPFFAHYKRPGVDQTVWPYTPSPNYADPNLANYNPGSNTKPDFEAANNNYDAERFKHRSGTVTMTWDINDATALTYLGNYQSFQYSFDRDNDFSSSPISSNGDTVLEDVWSYSHEFRLFWGIGERWTATTGIYEFVENRRQVYGIRNSTGVANNMFNEDAIYGPDGHERWMLEATELVGWTIPECFDYRTAVIGADGGYGKYCGDEGEAHSGPLTDNGGFYEQDNYNRTENTAFYTQGDFILTDTLSVTLGIRYSEDKRDVLEQRGGYSELESEDYPWLNWAIATTASADFDADQFYAEGVTPLAAINVAMGNATFTGDPGNPIAPVCSLTATECSHPLRLAGIPISWGSRARGDYKDENWSYRVNFNWEPTDETLIYAGITTGYRAGGFNLGGSENRIQLTEGDTSITSLLSYKPEKIKSFEIGYKGTFLDNRMQFNASVYLYDYTDYQDHVQSWESESSDFVLPEGIAAPSGRGPVDQTANIPEATNKGFEFDILYAVSQAFTIGGNYSYTKSEYDADFNYFNENDPRYPREILGGFEGVDQDPCTLAPEIAELYCINASGIQLTGIPKNKASVWASYSWEMEVGTLTFYTSVAYTGEYFTSPFARPWDEVPERSRTDMRLSLLSSDQKWSASIFADNIFDDRYIRWSDMDVRLSGYGQNFGHRAVALAPRFIGAELVYNF